jgi:hypothetical protein
MLNKGKEVRKEIRTPKIRLLGKYENCQLIRNRELLRNRRYA